ncbi:hypothetical protein BGW80DRAFT_1386006, partial [Lactifluus volemus]
PYYSAYIHFRRNSVTISFSPRSPSPIHAPLSFNIFCCGAVDWQVSSVTQICNQLSFVLSRIEQLSIDEQGWTLQDNIGDTQWLELFQPFTAVRTLVIFNNAFWSGLRGLSGGSAMQVLPALEELKLPLFHSFGYSNWPFVIAHQCSDRPVAVRTL